MFFAVVSPPTYSFPLPLPDALPIFSTAASANTKLSAPVPPFRLAVVFALTLNVSPPLRSVEQPSEVQSRVPLAWLTVLLEHSVQVLAVFVPVRLFDAVELPLSTSMF